MSPDAPIRIDGGQGEGGGQIVRTALFLSALLQRPVTIERIRAGRPKPGLKPQHVSILRGLESMCGARVEGAGVGSTRLEFRPAPVRPGTYEVDVGTAGSIPLVLQTLLPVCLLAEGQVDVTIQGGTDAAMAPSMDWFLNAYLPFVSPAFARLEVGMERRGFLPAGGGRVRVQAHGVSGDPARLRERIEKTLGGERSAAHPPWAIRCHSVAHAQLRERRVAERQLAAVLERFPEASGSTEYAAADSVGSAVTVWAEDGAGHRMGADALGERGRTAEDVGHRAAEALEGAIATQATADEHLADHLVPWVGLGARGLRPPRVSAHLLTNIAVTRTFLGAESLRWDGVALESGSVVRPLL